MSQHRREAFARQRGSRGHSDHGFFLSLWHGSAAVEACWSPCKTLRVAVAMPERFSVLEKTHGRCGRGNRAAARRPLADVDSSRWVAEGLTDKEIAKRTPKQSTLPVPPVIPPGEPRGGLLFPLTYELISTKYLLCVPNTTRLP